MTAGARPLGDLSAAVFLRDFWQRRPLLIRQAYPGFESPFSADELAGLACEPDVDARLVLQQGGRWKVRHGPFGEDDFARLPVDHWTLLVQEVNKYLPEAARLLDDFGFLPGWRVDDLMVSYAEDQGSVGPHLDRYDVFLLQAQGRRRWQIATGPVAPDNRLADTELCLLRDFNAEQDWLLEPGDLLYLPPGVAHHGVAEGPCMTFSVGFRAPAWAGLAEDYAHHLIDALDPAELYADPGIEPASTPGLIDQAVLARVRRGLRARLCADDAVMDAWFASRMSTPQRGEPSPPREDPVCEADFAARLAAGGELWRSDYSRFVFVDSAGAGAGAGDGVTLYVDGRAYPLPAELRPAVVWLTSHRALGREDRDAFLGWDALLPLLTRLYNNRALFFADEEDE